MPELILSEFDPKEMAPDATILIVGKRHTGKSVLMTDIMYHMKDRLDLVVGMNPTEQANHTLAHFTPPSFIFHGYDDTKLHHILEWQRRCVANERGKRVGFIMDDCMTETIGKMKVMKTGDINKVFKLGRHYKMFFICAMQYIKDAPPDVRGNVDLLFVFNTTSGIEREMLWKQYFGMFSKFKEFCKVFDACAQGYDCMVLDMRKAARTAADSIFYYRASLHPEKFKVGRPIFWKLSDYYFVDKGDYSMDLSRVLGKQSEELSFTTAGSELQIRRKPKDEYQEEDT
jgi:hypothetical protein